jgi:hypothetical protein
MALFAVAGLPSASTKLAVQPFACASAVTEFTMSWVATSDVENVTIPILRCAGTVAAGALRVEVLLACAVVPNAAYVVRDIIVATASEPAAKRQASLPFLEFSICPLLVVRYFRRGRLQPTLSTTCQEHVMD